jgi:hypothetical protein
MKSRQIDQSRKHSFLSSKPMTNWRKGCLNSRSRKSCRPILPNSAQKVVPDNSQSDD